MTSMSLRQGSNQNTRNLQGGAFARNPNFMQQFKGGGQPMSLKEQAGLIQGPGTGKSDSIEAKLPVKGFVLPVEVVQAYGADKLQAMHDLFMQDVQPRDQEEVDAKVSNGEFFVRPEVVAKTGPEYWDSLVQQVTGSPAQPEISQEGVKAAGGYGPNLSDERQAAQQFWSQSNRAVAPTPGRANPANPSDVMRDRMQTSAVNSQTQAQGLRSQISQNLANPVQAPIQPSVQPVSLKAQAQSVQPVQPTRQPAVSYFNAPKPPTLKDQLLGVGNDIALATSLASDVLQAPHIAKNRDDAISGLKARAGFSPTATPFQYAEGGYVDPEEERRRKALPPVVNAAVQGVDNTLNGVVDKRNQLREATQANRDAGYGSISGYVKAASDVNAPTLNAVKNIPASVGEGIASGYNALFGTPQETQVNTPPKNNSLKAAVFNPEQDKPKVTQATEQAAPSLKDAVAQSEGVRNITGKPVQSLDDQGFYTVTGENGATAKVLDWNTTQNSFQQTMGADDYNRLQAQNQDYQNQRNAAVIGGSNSYEKGEKGTYRASSSTDGFTPNTGLNLGSSTERTENAPKYNMKDGIIYQESGSSADEFNAKIPKTTNGVDPRAAQLINIIETGDADAQKEGRSLLAKHFPDIFTKYTIGLK
jgi:hypothetical protein